MLTRSLSIDAASFAAGTGWDIKPEGACKADACVPLKPGPFDAADAIARLGMATVHDADSGLWSIGPETLGGRALASAEAPDFELNDLAGKPFRLSSLRGKKVVVAAWAPY
jgi:hypothetical protein